MTTPIERLSNLVVGSVESVSPDEVRVLLELDAPHATALNTGTPAAFPRLNGYVLIPNERMGLFEDKDSRQGPSCWIIASVPLQ